MPVETRSRRRLGLGPIPEHKTVNDTIARTSRKRQVAVALSKRERTPSVGPVPIPETPATTNQSMLNEIALGNAPKKPKAAKPLERTGEDERIGVHHEHRIFGQGSESFLQTMPRSKVAEFKQLVIIREDNEKVVETEDEIRDREMEALRQDKKRMYRALHRLPPGVEALGPSGTWQMEKYSGGVHTTDQKSTTACNNDL